MAPEAILYRAPNGRFSLEDATLPLAPISPASANSYICSILGVSTLAALFQAAQPLPRNRYITQESPLAC